MKHFWYIVCVLFGGMLIACSGSLTESQKADVQKETEDAVRNDPDFEEDTDAQKETEDAVGNDPDLKQDQDTNGDSGSEEEQSGISPVAEKSLPPKTKLMTGSQVNEFIMAQREGGTEQYLGRFCVVSAEVVSIKTKADKKDPKRRTAEMTLVLPSYCAVDIVCSFHFDKVAAVTSKQPAETVTVAGKLNYIGRNNLRLEGCIFVKEN